jgi:hypothetical protein
VLRRWSGVGILCGSFGERPAICEAGEGNPPEKFVARDSIGFGKERHVRSNTTLERTRSRSSAKPMRLRARRSA